MIAAFIFKDIFNFKLLSGANSYNQIGLGMYGILYRIIIYIVQFLMTFSFFSYISSKKTIFTSIGEKTFNIYILHGFVIKLLVALSYFDSISLAKIMFLPLLTMMMLIIFGNITLNLQISKLEIFDTSK